MASLLSAAADALSSLTAPCGLSEIKDAKPDTKNAPPALHLCDICMEDVPASEAVVHLCSDATVVGADGNTDGTADGTADGHKCPGCFCKGCAKQYVEHIVKDGYDGACPQVKCPACPGRIIPSSKWAPVVDKATKDAIGDRAMKLLSLQCSSCHARKSLMIGHDPMTLAHTGDEAWNTAATTAEQQLKVTFGQHYKSFVMARERYLRGAIKEGDFLAQLTPLCGVADAIVKGSAKGPCPVVLQVINSITDPERRATFHVAYMRKFPECWTRCHKARHCFRCHITGYHDGMSCAEYQMSKATVEDIVPCPQCGVQLTKGDGCASVNCVCGKSFNWDQELAKVRGALAKLFEDTLQADEEAAAEARYQKECKLRLLNATSTDAAATHGLGLGGGLCDGLSDGLSAEETKDEHGAPGARANASDQDAIASLSAKRDEATIRHVLSVWKEAKGANLGEGAALATDPAADPAADPALPMSKSDAASKIQGGFFRMQWKKRKTSTTSTGSLPPLPPKVKVPKLTTKTIADKAALMVYNEGSDEMHVRAAAWATTHGNDTSKARCRMWDRRYPLSHRAPAAHYYKGLKLPATDRDMLVINGWVGQNHTLVQSHQQGVKKANQMAWKAMYPTTSTSTSTDCISAANRAYLRQTNLPEHFAVLPLGDGRKAMAAYNELTPSSVRQGSAADRYKEHADAWDYLHEKPNGFANGAHETMLNGIDWPANTALTITELGVNPDVIKRALGGDTRCMLFSSWKQVYGLALTNCRLNQASSERWVRLTSPELLNTLHADTLHDEHDEHGEHGEHGEEAKREEEMRELELLKEELDSQQNQKGGRRNGAGGRRQRSRSLHLIGRTRGGNGSGNGSGNGRVRSNSTLMHTANTASTRLTNKLKAKKEAKQKKAARAAKAEDALATLAIHTKHLGGTPLPECLWGKGPIEAAVDVEVARATNDSLRLIPRHEEYYKTWINGGWHHPVHGTTELGISKGNVTGLLTEAKAKRWEAVYGQEPCATAVSVELGEMKVGDGEGEMSRVMGYLLPSWRALNEHKVHDWKVSQWEQAWGSRKHAVTMAVEAEVWDKTAKISEHKIGDFCSNFNGHEVQPWGVSAEHRASFPVLEGPFAKAVLKMGWCDQGWGNQKGHIHARVQGGEWQRISPSVAPHSMAIISIELPQNLIDGSEGTILELGYEVGGGGGHALNISNSVITTHPLAKDKLHVNLDKRQKAYLKAWIKVPANHEAVTALKSDRWLQLHGVDTGKATGNTAATGIAVGGASSLSAEEPSVESSVETVFQSAVKAAVDVDEGLTALRSDTAQRVYYEAWVSNPMSAKLLAGERARRTLERREAFEAAYDDVKSAAEAAVAITAEAKKVKDQGLTGHASAVDFLPVQNALERHFGDNAGTDGNEMSEEKKALAVELVLRATAWAEANPDPIEFQTLLARWQRRCGKDPKAKCPQTLEELRAWNDSNMSNYSCCCGESFDSASEFYRHCGLACDGAVHKSR